MKPTLEELRQMPYHKLGRYCPKIQRCDLKAYSEAISKGIFEVISDNSKTSRQMIDELKTTKRKVNIYRYLLILDERIESKIKHIPYEDNYRMIMRAVKKPISHRELKNITGLESRLLVPAIKDLVDSGKLVRFELGPRSRNKGSFNSHELLGDLANNVFVYKPSQMYLLKYMILEHIPVEKFPDRQGMYHSITAYLSGSLTKELFDDVHKLYQKAYAILKKVDDANKETTRQYKLPDGCRF